MPPKSRASGITPKSHQSTLAFHGASNKVTKAGARAQVTKKNVVEEPVDRKSTADIEEPSTADDEVADSADATLIQQTQREALVSTPEEEEARKISDAKIEEYWTEKEDQRKAPRVHQNDLSLHEKILREFDMSGQYGPCTGIAREKRWKRAHRLNLEPPIEVLAVLLKEQDGKDKVSVQRSHVDELLNLRSAELELGA